jgi:hypothetical protein
MFFSSYMEKQTVIYPDNGILFCNEKEQIADMFNNMDKSERHSAK